MLPLLLVSLSFTEPQLIFPEALSCDDLTVSSSSMSRIRKVRFFDMSLPHFTLISHSLLKTTLSCQCLLQHTEHQQILVLVCQLTSFITHQVRSAALLRKASCCHRRSDTAPSSNSSLHYKSPLQCPIASLCLHASLVHIECPNPSIRLLIWWRSAPGLVATIANTNIAIGTIPSLHTTPL